MKLLALDGPLNGQYIEAAEATANGYEYDVWPNDEEVWAHGSVPIEPPHEERDDLAYTERIR